MLLGGPTALCPPPRPRAALCTPPQQAVFNLELDFSDDDGLLDYEQYSGLRRLRCCGCDWTPVTRLLPCLPAGPPDWWFSYTRRQRRLILGAAGCLAALTLLLLGLAVAALLRATGLRGAAGGGGQAAGAEALCGWQDWRLPTTLVPLEYNLSLEVQMEAPYLVLGAITISLNVTQVSPAAPALPCCTAASPAASWLVGCGPLQPLPVSAARLPPHVVVVSPWLGGWGGLWSLA